MRTLGQVLLLLLLLGVADGAAWQPPRATSIRERALAWLDQQKVDSATRDAAQTLWSAAPADMAPEEALSRLVETFAMADPRVETLAQLCSAPRGDALAPDQPWLFEADTPAWMAANLRLWYGRWLVRERLFDEARVQLAGLQPDDVVDPASLLFHQAVVHHRLLEKTPAIEAIDRLLAAGDAVPRRYTAVAQLMRDDLEILREDTLGHIARRMEDIQRRLELGRAGNRVIEVERGVVESLDKLIKKLESQQQQAAGAEAQIPSPSRPAEDSEPIGGRGLGRVTQRALGAKSGWGNLPPKQREEALQQLERDFPAHYQDIIEQYFRRLAAEEDGSRP